MMGLDHIFGHFVKMLVALLCHSWLTGDPLLHPGFASRWIPDLLAEARVEDDTSGPKYDHPPMII